MENKKEGQIDILTIYSNYLHTLEYNNEYGDKYGDSLELIKFYEERLKIHSIKPIKQGSK